MALRQFELKSGCGPHVEKNSDGEKVKYEPGEVIHSDKDYCAIWPHKFKELGISKEATKKKKKTEEEKDADEDDSTVKKMLRENKKALKHENPDNEEDVEIEDEEEEIDEDEEVDETEVKSKFGKDVSKDFEDLVKADLKVFSSKKKGFTVVENDDPTKSLVKKKKAEDVEKWFAHRKKKG